MTNKKTKSKIIKPRQQKTGKPKINLEEFDRIKINLKRLRKLRGL